MTFIDFLTEMREPKTQQERQADHSDDSEPKPRAKRNKKNLPTSWTDKEPIQQRTWKKTRKNQYK